MARLAIGKEFLAEYAKLDRDTRSAVDTAIAEFARQTHAGPFLETPRDSRDSRIRTIGIDGVLRGVVLAPDNGDTYCLLTVLPRKRRMISPMKGLEFQAVAVIGVEQGLVPEPGAVTPETEEPLAYAQDLQRERCALFVACTRARDHLHVSGTGEPSPFLPPGAVEPVPPPAALHSLP